MSFCFLYHTLMSLMFLKFSRLAYQTTRECIMCFLAVRWSLLYIIVYLCVTCTEPAMSGQSYDSNLKKLELLPRKEQDRFPNVEGSYHIILELNNIIPIQSFSFQGSIEEKIYQRQIIKNNLSGTIVDSLANNKVRFSSEELKVKD